MKKILFSVALFAAALGASAIDEVGLETTTFQAGKTAVVKVILNTTSYNNEMKNIMFDMYFPTGWAISTGATSMKTNTERTIGEVWDSDFEEWVESGDFTPQVSKQTVAGYAAYRTSLLTPDNHALKGNEGWIYSITVKAPSDAVPGYYPVKIVKAYMNKDAVDANNVVFPDAVCYMKVGEPENANLALEGVVPSFVNESLATETGLASLDLEKVTALNGDFTYVDGRDVVGTTATASVKYVGNKAEKEYYSVNVPFGGAVTGNVYELSDVTEEFAIFNEATSVVAGKTYLAEGAVTLAANAAVAGVATETGKEGSYVLDGQFWHGKNLTVPATRGLFDVPAGSNLRVVIDGVLTNITTAQIEAGETSYDLQGRQVQNAKNGVFVVNGKKQFVK